MPSTKLITRCWLRDHGFVRKKAWAGYVWRKKFSQYAGIEVTDDNFGLQVFVCRFLPRAENSVGYDMITTTDRLLALWFALTGNKLRRIRHAID